jgi:hypothetical protein
MIASREAEMTLERIKQAVSGHELVGYCGTWKTGFEIVQAGGERFAYSPTQVKDLFKRSARHNPLLHATPPECSRAEGFLTAWAKAEFGRGLKGDEATRLYAVFSGEGMPPEEFFPDGCLSNTWPPKISPLKAVEECISRDCVYQEKQVFLFVRLAAASMDAGTLWLDLDVLPGPFDNGPLDVDAGKRLRIGGDSGNMRVNPGHLEFSNFISWSLLTGEHWIKFLTTLAATKPPRDEMVTKFRELMRFAR